ncbi:MAG: hypothetical protein H6684_13090 [Deltaproteobacteria bacterium]|nr:hypothetical protein [Deltaproteobacteria bacterium]
MTTPPTSETHPQSPVDETARRRVPVFAALLVAAILWPLIEFATPIPEDSFPLSYFPMFSDHQRDTDTLNYVIAEDNKGHRANVPPALVTGGSNSMNLARKQLNKIVDRGPDAMKKLCRKIAKRARRATWKGFRPTRIRVVTGEYSIREYFAGNKEPLSEVTHVTCKIPRRRGRAK